MILPTLRQSARLVVRPAVFRPMAAVKPVRAFSVSRFGMFDNFCASLELRLVDTCEI